ncbi:transposase, partial [Gordonia amicalis]
MSMALDDKQQAHDDEPLPELAEPCSTAEVAEALQASGMVDELLAQFDTGQVQITGEGGLIPGLIKLALERGLKAELTDHLGYEKGDPAGRELPNARNGSSPKTVASEAGPVELN